MKLNKGLLEAILPQELSALPVARFYFPFFSFNASTTFSGVMGSSHIRIPTAS